MSDFLFEARLERAARLYAEEAVRPIDAGNLAEWAIGVAGRGRADRRLFGRWPRAWVLIAAAALVVVALAASFFVGSRPSNEVVQPSPSSAPSVTPSTSPADTPSPPPVGVDTTQSGTWLADIPSNTTFEGATGPTRMTLTVDSVPEASVALVDGVEGLFRSSVLTFGVGEIRFTSVSAPPGGAVIVDGSRLPACTAGDEGHYRLTESGDGLRLTLSVVTEACPSREAILARTWTRSLRVPSGGGSGVVDGFDPLFTVVLPTGNYVVDRDPDSTTIRQEFPEFKFASWKDPQGWNDPCDEAKGRYAIAPGADAIVAYFRQLHGFTVDATTEMEIDGHRAVRLDVHANPDASCPAGWLNEWQPKSVTSDLTWYLRPGDTDSLFIVETPSATVMFEILPVPDARGLAVIDSIHFVDRLPTTP